MAGSIDGYIKIDGAEGESTADGYTGQIEVLAFAFGDRQAKAGSVSSGGSQSSGRVELLPVGFVHTIDKATPNLHKLCASGKHIDEITMTLVRTIESATEYFSITLKKTLIADVVMVAHTGEIPCFGGESGLPTLAIESDLPVEAVQLWPTEIEWKYTETKKDGTKGGTVKAGYSQETHKVS